MKRIVFCDFDGTITEEETFVGMLRRFAAEDYRRVEQRILDGSMTLAHGVRRLVESIPSAMMPEMQRYIRRKRLRPGFSDWLDFLEAARIPLVVVSGGIGIQVRTRLAAFEDRIHAVIAAEVTTEEPNLTVVSEFEDERELVAKARVMAGFDYDEAAVVGDGITDISMAKEADLVFARDGLARELDRIGVSSRPWQSFFDVRRQLARQWRLPEQPA